MNDPTSAPPDDGDSAFAGPSVLVIGAGPAGLSAAWELARTGARARIHEKDSTVGGLARTVVYKGYRFDIGGHRLFTKVTLVRELWRELLGDDLLSRPRLSRNHYRGRFFKYPLEPLDALVGLGPIEASRVVLSYLKARAMPAAADRTFEQWVTNRFGRRLYENFFKTYTEKVWGMPCSEISSEWAAQRIKNLNLARAVLEALLGGGRRGEVISTLIDRFHYPRLGPGMMWERCSERLDELGVETTLESAVERLHHDGRRILRAAVRAADGQEHEVEADHFISTMPIPELVRSLRPEPPPEILAAARSLRYRDFLSVVLIVDRQSVLPDNWIYIHSPTVKVGRVQNYKNWSPEMVPDPAKTALGLEYFVHQGDELWSAEDSDLIEFATQELESLGLISAREIEDGVVVRMPKAYPVYAGDYRQALSSIRGYLGRFSNLQTIGRNGQHRYNNQDHSMLAGVLAARNIAGESHDVWAINVEQDYLEAADDSAEATGRRAPQPALAPSVEVLLRHAFARYDPLALGVAVGVVAGLGLFLATAILLLRGGEPLGPTLSLLGNYLFGYRVSWPGALIGSVEAGVGGFALGYLIARQINLLVGFTRDSLTRRLEAAAAFDPLEAVARDR